MLAVSSPQDIKCVEWLFWLPAFGINDHPVNTTLKHCELIKAELGIYALVKKTVIGWDDGLLYVWC